MGKKARPDPMEGTDVFYICSISRFLKNCKHLFAIQLESYGISYEMIKIIHISFTQKTKPSIII